MGFGRGGGGVEYLKSAPGILDQWQPLFAFYIMFHLLGMEGWVAIKVWMILTGVWGLFSLIFMLLKVFGVEVPSMLLTVFYIIGAIIGIVMGIVMLILAFVETKNAKCGRIKCEHPHCPTAICVSITMGVFYIYSAVVNCGGK